MISLFIVCIDSKTWKHSYQLATAIGIFERAERVSCETNNKDMVSKLGTSKVHFS